MMCPGRTFLPVAKKGKQLFPVAFTLLAALLVHSPSFGMGLSFGDVTPASTPTATATYLASIPAATGEPSRIAIDSAGFIYITVPENGTILKYSADGSLAGRLQGFQEPLSLAVDSTLNRLYVGDARDGSVGIFDPEGKYKSSLGKGKGEFGIPGDIAIAQDGSVYVTDSPNDTVKAYNPDGSFRFSFGSSGSGPGQLSYPTGIAVDTANQEIYVVDHSNARVAVFGLAGGFNRSFSGFGSGQGKLTRPQGIWVSNGLVFVADAFQSTVSIFDSSGTSLAQLGQFGSDAGQLRIPKDVAMSGAKLFVANAGNRRIEVFSVSTAPGLNAEPAGIAFTQEAVATPASQIIQLTPLVAGSAVPWTATVSAPFALMLSQTTGTAPSSLAVTANAANLAPGAYFGGVIFHANGVDYPVSVTMAVVPQISVFPASLSLLYQVNGELTATSLAVSTTGALSWTAATNVPWLTLSPASGSASGSIAVNLNQGVRALPEGSYPAAVTVRASDGTGSALVVPLALKVMSAGTIIVNTNLAASSAVISGPETYTLSGKTWWRTDEARPGTYTIRYGSVAGYRRPPSSTFEVTTGQTAELDGWYRKLSSANVIITAKGPAPENDALLTVLDLKGAPLTSFMTFTTNHGAQVAAGDLDGDGFDEIIAAPGAGPKNEARIGIYRADGTLLALSEPLANTHYGGQVAVGDIDGRGRRVIALSAVDGDSGNLKVVLYGLDDSRNIVERTRVTIGASEGAAGNGTRYPAHVAFGDVNRDGKLELIAVTRSNIEVYSLDDAWNASLLAARTTPFLPGSPAYQVQFTVASGDLDGDDTDEVIVGYEKDQDSFIQVFKGDLTVSGTPLRVFERAKSAPMIHARDWDGDGLADILAGEGAYPDNEAILRVFGPQGGLVGEMKAPGDFRYGVVPTFGTIRK